MQAPAAESAALTGPILLQFWTENFDSACPNGPEDESRGRSALSNGRRGSVGHGPVV
jgi:hypothetical protein